MTNAHSETGQMAVCCQNLPLCALSSRSAPFVLVGALFKKFGLFLNTSRIRSGHFGEAVVPAGGGGGGGLAGRAENFFYFALAFTSQLRTITIKPQSGYRNAPS
jgi:hypothetical protein